jgi:hypothetical protein
METGSLDASNVPRTLPLGQRFSHARRESPAGRASHRRESGVCATSLLYDRRRTLIERRYSRAPPFHWPTK